MLYLLSFLILFTLNYYYFSSVNSKCLYIYSPCSKELFKKAITDNTVIITAVSRKFITQIYNFWISSALPNNFTSIFFISSDYFTYNYCKSFTKNVLLGENIINQKDDIVFMNHDYVKITVSRLKMIYYLLKMKFMVLVIDLDIYLFKNPLPYLIRYKEDIVTTLDSNKNINVGF